MQQQAFESALAQDGFGEIEARSLPADHSTSDHSHPFDVRALVTGGEITLTTGGVDTCYRSGEVFVMAAGQTHRDQVGPAGVSYVVGRRDGQPAG